MSPHLHPESAESADLIATAKEEAARLRDQQAAVKTTEYRLGTALHQIKKDMPFVAAGYATFAAFVAELGLKLKDADWYIATRNIPDMAEYRRQLSGLVKKTTNQLLEVFARLPRRRGRQERPAGRGERWLGPVV